MSQFGKTTDLAIIRKDPHRFTWGKVISIQDIGRYTIVTSINDSVTQSSFHAYCDGEDTQTYASSVGAALILAIAYGSLDVNWDIMAKAACKLLEVK